MPVAHGNGSNDQPRTEVKVALSLSPPTSWVYKQECGRERESSHSTLARSISCRFERTSVSVFFFFFPSKSILGSAIHYPYHTDRPITRCRDREQGEPEKKGKTQQGKGIGEAPNHLSPNVLWHHGNYLVHFRLLTVRKSSLGGFFCRSFPRPIDPSS